MDDTTVPLHDHLEFTYPARTYACILLLATAFFSILLHAVFILSIRKLCGWGSNFSFTILLLISVFSIINFLTDLAAYTSSCMRISRTANMRYLRIISSIHLSVPYAVIVLTLMLGIHRFIYSTMTLAVRHISPFYAKISLCLPFLAFLSNMIATQTSWMGARFSTTALTHIYMMNGLLQYQISEVFNYFTGLGDLVIYSILFAILYYRKQLTFTKNHELKMTCQVLLMTFFQLSVFLFWEFLEPTTPFMEVAGMLSNSVYYNLLIVPYIIFNKKIHREMKSWLRRTPEKKLSETFLNKI